MKIVVLEPLGIPAERVREILRGAAGAETEVVCYPDRVTEPEALGARCAGAEIAVLANLPFPRAAIERCDSLKLLCVAFTGVDHVDVDCCRERGVAVCNCAGYATTAVAELTFGLLFSLLRRLPAVEERCRDGGVRDGLIGRELEGKTLGVVGSGAIGSRVCALAGAFGCRVLACNRSGRPVSGAESVTLEELLRESDIVSLHTPLTPETRGMIGREQLAMMKPGALLLNTARGDVVDSAALREALESGHLAGAGVDVFHAEPPLGEEPLLGAPNCVFTPHIGFATHEAFEKRAALVGGNIAAFLRGEERCRIC